MGDERQQKVQELKRWIKRKEMEQEELSPMEKLEIVASKSPLPMDKLEQDHAEMRDRRASIAEKRRTALAMTMASIRPPQRVLHRHVHHHVHYHDGVSADEAAGNFPGA